MMMRSALKVTCAADNKCNCKTSGKLPRPLETLHDAIKARAKRVQPKLDGVRDYAKTMNDRRHLKVTRIHDSFREFIESECQIASKLMEDVGKTMKDEVDDAIAFDKNETGYDIHAATIVEDPEIV